jgi:ubiquinone/menaquinone biosynthesis C-methylase UbiE
VLDLGCGPGFWTVEAAERVGEGWVVGLDPSLEMLRVCRERARGRPILHCRGDGAALPFADGVFGRVFVVNLLHEVADPGHVLGEAFRCVAPGGDLVVVDFEARETDFGPPLAARIPAETMLTLLRGPAGTSPISPVAAYEDFYALRVERA